LRVFSVVQRQHRQSIITLNKPECHVGLSLTVQGLSEVIEPGIETRGWIEQGRMILTAM
jgi:hypothetical protein